ncbi:MAG TPA: hypothetical protein DGD08_01860 [Gemmatimonas aurantiaca]|uniref:DUF4157 domain-containing protein n=2 Tax=Gemmatimonas aurantiaca TaxID=173480 RepID=C1AAQ2_GEMAT|nr:hypothetical protein [Gemmatimonas aurantiaca]BAH39308.1 hypothetical protein GAU_2266 [Gemmatimonas aurantiaca T-27]HCT55939.1 hypothetical protein [Gemmatimonas aurantiaca]
MSTSKIMVVEGIRVRATTNARVPRAITWLRYLPRRVNDWALRHTGRTPLPEHLRPSRLTLGVTLGVHMRFSEDGPDVSPQLFTHEFQHVLQRKRLGFWEYYRRYLVDLVRDGYDHDHDLEREAREYARDNAARFARYCDMLPRRSGHLNDQQAA